MTRLLTLSVLTLALVSTHVEAASKRLRVIGQVSQQTFTGDLANPKLGDQLISNAELFDEHDNDAGTGTGACTIVSVPPLDTLLQCVLVAVLTKGQLIFGGVAPLPAAGVVAHFGIFGGTDDFRKARGDVTFTVITPMIMDAIFEIE